MPRLNPRELDVLNILWKSDEPMTSTDIVNQQRGLTQSTVIAVLRKLLNDGLVEITGVTYSGKVLSRTYRATEESKNAIMDYFANDYASFKNVVSKSEMCAAILGVEQSPEQLRDEVSKLREILDNFEKNMD